MELNSWPGLAAIILAVISFYGTTYLVIALNVGWRFGYWVSSACFGALMVLLSIFWVVNPVGPRGAEPVWLPLAAERDAVAQASYGEQRFTTPGQFPQGSWEEPGEDDTALSESLSSAVTTCISTDPDSLAENLKEPCEAAQGLMPASEDIPVLEGTPVSVQPEVEELRFTEESGAQLGMARIVPITHDPRVADDPEAGEAMGESFVLLAIYDKGSIVLPAYGSLAIFVLYTLFHMIGLHRAEQRKLSPVAA